MKRVLIFAVMIFNMQALGEEDFKLILDGRAKPTISMPSKPAARVAVKSEEKASDLTRSYFGVASYTSNLQKDLGNLEATPLAVSDGASLRALRNAASSTEGVARYLPRLRATASGAADKAAVQKAIKDAEEALARYEHLREEMVERKK
jgi:hypothetical protein